MLVLFAAAVTLPYLPSLGNGFVYDDQVLIVHKPPPASVSDALSVFKEMHHPSGLQYYRPLSALTLATQKAIWGNSPLPYHLFNLLLLLCVALVVRRLYLSFMDERASTSLMPVAFAALFALHPLVSSTVHAISGRETLLVVLFMAASTWAFVRPGTRWLILAMVLFAAALLCKEQAVALVPMFVLADWLRVSADSPRRKPTRRERAWAWAARYVAVAVLLALYFAIRASVISGAGPRVRPLELSLLEDPGRPFLSIVYAVQTIFVPTADLSYEPHLTAWWSAWRLLVTVTGAAGLGWLAVRFARPERRVLGFWVGWVLVSILPSANILVQETHYAERYVVLPLLGVLGLAAVVAHRMWAKEAHRFRLGAVVVLALVAAAGLSFHRGRFFKDDYRFLKQWAKSDPRSIQAQASLSEHHRKRSEWKQALPYERESLRLAHKQLPEPLCIKRHFGLAYVLVKLRRYEEAAAEYEEILRLKPHYRGARSRLRRVRVLSANAPPPLPVTPSCGLNEASRSRLSALLKARDLTGRPVWFTSTRRVPCSMKLQAALEAVFRDAGWQVRGTAVVGFGIKPGLYLLVADRVAPAYVERLHRALNKAGLTVRMLATDYRAYARGMFKKNPAWRGFRLAADQDYVLVVGRLAAKQP